MQAVFPINFYSYHQQTRHNFIGTRQYHAFATNAINTILTVHKTCKKGYHDGQRVSAASARWFHTVHHLCQRSFCSQHRTPNVPCSFDESDPLGGVQSGISRLQRIADYDNDDINELIYGSDDNDSLFDSLPDEPTSPGVEDLVPEEPPSPQFRDLTQEELEQNLQPPSPPRRPAIIDQGMSSGRCVFL